MLLLLFSRETFTKFNQYETIKYTLANAEAWKPCNVSSLTTAKLKLKANNRNTARRPPDREEMIKFYATPGSKEKSQKISNYMKIKMIFYRL